MRKSKSYSEFSGGLSSQDDETGQPPGVRARTASRRVHVPKKSCKDHFSLVEPQINAEGFMCGRLMFPARGVLFLTEDGRRNVRMNRHGYFEVSVLLFGVGGLSYPG